MKYCGNCGSPMNDDMLFCQKCGTKFEEIENHSKENICADDSSSDKIAKLKKYNLMADSGIFSYEVRKDNMDKCIKVFEKMFKLLNEVEQTVLPEALAAIETPEQEYEVYSYIVNLALRMLKEGNNLVSDVGGYAELVEQSKYLVSRGLLSDSKANADIDNYEELPKTLYGFHVAAAITLIEKLDPEVIYLDDRYWPEMKNIALYFSLFIQNFTRRLLLRDAFINLDYYKSQRETFVRLVKGLPQVELDLNGEVCWDFIAETAIEKMATRDYKTYIDKARLQEKKERAEWELSINEKINERVWLMYPEENEVRKKILCNITELEETLAKIESEIQDIHRTLSKCDNEIKRKKEEISKLEKKIFGKQKALELAEQIKSELPSLMEKKDAIQESLKNKEQERSALNIKVDEMKFEIEKLKRNISDFR